MHILLAPQDSGLGVHTLLIPHKRWPQLQQGQRQQRSGADRPCAPTHHMHQGRPAAAYNHSNRSNPYRGGKQVPKELSMC